MLLTQGGETKIAQVSGSYINTASFFTYSASLRAQYDWKVTLGRARHKYVLSELKEMDLYRIQCAPADRIFTQSIMIKFLNALRQWSGPAIGTSYASSPQVEVFSTGCWRSMSQESTPAPWRYLYVLGPHNAGSTRIKVMDNPGNASNALLGVNRVKTLALEFNSLLVHRSSVRTAVEPSSTGETDPLTPIFLIGDLW